MKLYVALNSLFRYFSTIKNILSIKISYPSLQPVKRSICYVYLPTKKCSNVILSKDDLQCIPIHLSKTFSVQRKTFSKAIFLKYFSSFDFCQDHDSHKGSNWNLFPTSTTLRKRGHYRNIFSNVRIGLLDITSIQTGIQNFTFWNWTVVDINIFW